MRRPGGVDDVRRAEHLVAGLDRARAGDEGEVVAADLAAADVEDARRPVVELAGRELVRLEDRHELVDAGGALQAEAGDVLSVAQRADDGHQLTARRMRAGARVLDALDDGLDLVLCCRRLHHDHHSFSASFHTHSYTPGRTAGILRRSERELRELRRVPTERLDKSPGENTDARETVRLRGAVRKERSCVFDVTAVRARASRNRWLCDCGPKLTRSAPGLPSDPPARTMMSRSFSARTISGSSASSGRSNHRSSPGTRRPACPSRRGPPRCGCGRPPRARRAR